VFSLVSLYISPMSLTTQQLLKRLKGWCDKKRGRRVEVSKLLGISPQALTNWFGARQQPTADQILKVLAFLDKQRKQRK
jgi:hypothetical protein